MDYLREINLASIALRVVLSLAVGGILGLERGRRNRPAGFRTYMLVCLGSALVMMTNQYVFQFFNVSDPVRMGAQVVSGIGFLGAGTIILTGRSQNQVRGITTAAGLWAAACCGLAIGIGFYEGAVICGVVIFLIMWLLQRLDTRIRQHAREMEIYLEMDPGVLFSQFIEYARQNDIDISDLQIQKNKAAPEKTTSVVLIVQSRVRRTHNEMIELLSTAPGVRYIEELE